MEKKKIKVLNIIHSEIGGAGDVALTLDNFNSRDVHSDYLFTGPAFFEGFKKKIKILKKKKFYLPIKKGLHFFKTFDVIKKIKLINPDIIIIHNYQILSCLYFKFFYKKKIIYVDHMSLKLKNYKNYLCIYLSFIFFDRIIFINEENFNKFQFLNKYKTKLIKNSCTDFYLKNKKYKKKKLLRVGISGRINYLKNHQLVLDLINKDEYLKKKILVFIAGSGENKKNILNFIKINKLQSIVKYSGELDENSLKSWFYKIDLYLHPSFGEAMSTSILQALSSFTPVLASNVSGINNLIEKKKYLGKLFNNDLKDLKKKLIYFIKLSGRDFYRFQKVQRDFYLKKYSQDIFKKKYLKEINDIK